MLAFFVSAAVHAASPTPGTAIEWGCRFRSATGDATTLLGVIVSRRPTTKADAATGADTALLVVSDTANRYQNKGARGAYLRQPRSGEYWAFFDGAKGDGLILRLDTKGKGGHGQLIRAGAALPSAEGQCEYRTVKDVEPS